MNLLDSCGWLEYFANGPNASFFAKPIEDSSRTIVPTICIFEVYKRLLQQCGEDVSISCVSVMRQGCVIPLDTGISTLAAKLSVEYKIPMADSIILATATPLKAIIWTQDADFENIPNVKYISKKK